MPKRKDRTTPLGVAAHSEMGTHLYPVINRRPHRERQLMLSPERLRIYPRRSSSRSGEFRIYGWGWYCPCCDYRGGTNENLSYYHPERDVPTRVRCFRLAYQHLVRKHGYVPAGTQLELIS